ncbi:MAG TPA: hypothetical protein VFJ30_10925 [Phycisphaerae bacterium]|nr:hypothetical protein [Phycisphaerae bacterium]
MRYGFGAAAVALAAGLCLGQVDVQAVRELRKDKTDEKGRVTPLFRFDEQYLTMAEEAVIRGNEAAEAWGLFDKRIDELPVVARSPYGGGETDATYWPAQVDPQLLRVVAKNLSRKGLNPILPELPAEKPEGADEDAGAEKAEAPDAGAAPAGPPTPPWPKDGFPEPHKFVLVIGLHYEPIPYQSGQAPPGTTGLAIRSSRVNAWAILFHSAGGTAFWGATATARADHRADDDPINTAARAALNGLDFDDLGKHNLRELIGRYKARQELPAIDVAALLVQSQRADAVEAVVKSAMGKGAFTETAWVLRWYNQKGTVQDFRIDPEQAQRQRCVRVSQRVMMRILLLEQLRGVRGIQPSVQIAVMPYEDDIEVQPIGSTYGGRLRPLGEDDEIVLLGTLAHRGVWDQDTPFHRNQAGAVGLVGKCRLYIDQALAIAQVYASRPQPQPRRGRPQRDALREAGIAAVAELQKTRAELKKKQQERMGE